MNEEQKQIPQSQSSQFSSSSSPDSVDFSGADFNEPIQRQEHEIRDNSNALQGLSHSTGQGSLKRGADYIQMPRLVSVQNMLNE